MHQYQYFCAMQVHMVASYGSWYDGSDVQSIDTFRYEMLRPNGIQKHTRCIEKGQVVVVSGGFRAPAWRVRDAPANAALSCASHHASRMFLQESACLYVSEAEHQSSSSDEHQSDKESQAMIHQKPVALVDP